MPSFVIGELACGSLPDPQRLLDALRDLHQAPVATHAEALGFLTRFNLRGRRIGWIGVHLLASAMLAGHAPLFTRDKRLAAVAHWKRLTMLNLNMYRSGDNGFRLAPE